MKESKAFITFYRTSLTGIAEIRLDWTASAEPLSDTIRRKLRLEELFGHKWMRSRQREMSVQFAIARDSAALSTRFAGGFHYSPATTSSGAHIDANRRIESP